MKKHIIFIVNIILVIAVLAGVGYAMYKASIMPQPQADDKKTTQKATPDEATVDKEKPPVILYNVGIIQHSNDQDSNDVYLGFIEQLEKSGFVHKQNIYLDYVLEEDEALCEEAIQSFIDNEYDLIFTIGPFASKLAASMTTEIPIVFGAVEEPEEEKLVEKNEVPGGNVTGVSDYTPCFEQIDSIKVLFPNCGLIGAIYNGTDTEATTQAVLGEKEAKTEAVNIPYKKYPIESQEKVEAVLENVLKDGVDVIYAPIDPFITENLETIVDFSNEHKIPIICGNLEMLQKGCFSTSIISYPSIGHAAGDMTLNILNNKVSPATLPVAYINDCYLHINVESLIKLDVELSKEIEDSAIIE